MIDTSRADGREFAAAYYRWALDQWHQEVEFGFPLLRAVRNHSCDILFHILKSKSRGEAIRIAQLLTKRFHPEAVEMLNEALRPEELEFLDRLDRQCLRLLPPRPTRRARLSRSLLKKNVREAVSPILGTESEKTSTEWCYTSTMGRWPIRTIIHFAGGNFNMSYQQDIVLGPEEWRMLAG